MYIAGGIARMWITMTCTEASIHGVVKKICSSLGQRRQPARNFKGGEGRRRLSERRRLLTGGKLRERRGKTDLYIYQRRLWNNPVTSRLYLPMRICHFALWYRSWILIERMGWSWSQNEILTVSQVLITSVIAGIVRGDFRDSVYRQIVWI